MEKKEKKKISLKKKKMKWIDAAAAVSDVTAKWSAEELRSCCGQEINREFKVNDRLFLSLSLADTATYIVFVLK